jgi:hypothetical protein
LSSGLALAGRRRNAISNASFHFADPTQWNYYVWKALSSQIQTVKEEHNMTKKIAILVMAMGMSVGLASHAPIALAQPQDDKMQSDSKMQGDDKMQSDAKMQGDEKMKDDSMAGGKMEHGGKAAKKKSKKDKMSHDKMGDQDKMSQPQQ